ncbi:cyanophycin synthetase [Chelativorans sp.]|uniref:cyanophycin synthetase n=1 Tax=Chelativorans sp. TaxID=2203393 RepID=UPI0028120190|nr:cyanophycin synthetase [Chelativorans sp.]
MNSAIEDRTLIGFRPMHVREVAIYRGPHFYSELPMIRIQLDLGDLEHWPTNRLPGFAERLAALLPGLQSHGCSYGTEGGFIRRLEEGTWLGHVTEHVALELQTMMGSRATRGKTRSVRGKPGVYNVMYAYSDEPVALLAGRIALELVQHLLPAELRGIQGLDEIYETPETPFDLAERLEALKDLHRDVALGPTTASLVREAQRRDIPVWRVDDTSLVQLGQGKYQKRIRASCTGITSEIATEIACDKDLTKRLLQEAGIPVPRGSVVRSADEAVKAAEDLGYPVVVKPLEGNHGRGVTIGIETADEVRWAFDIAREHDRTILVEQQFSGSDHRILVIGGEVVAVAERLPAHVVGDGRRSIAELIEMVNLDPRRDEGHSAFLTRIEVDECVEHFLEKRGLTLASIPPEGRRVDLRPTANLSTGGTAIDRTDEIHPENALIARRAAQIVGLDVAGIDFLCPDIRRPVSETGGGIIEVNAGPGFRMHLQPSEGRSRNVARPMIDLLFPPGSRSRVPIFAITGTNGKSTTSRMLAHILKHAGLKVGLAMTTGIFIDGQRIAKGDCSGPRSARLILREPTIDAAVLEVARGGILREGLGFDRCDIGAVLNVSADHLGLRGLDTVEDLAQVKGVVVESVARNGWSILNADNQPSASLERVARGRICYFSMRGKNEWPAFLRRHIAEGGRAVTCEIEAGRYDIVIHEDCEKLFVMDAAEIPATFGGLADFNVENALAAIAMAYAQDVPLGVIRKALCSFATSFEELPGRLNRFDGHGFTTIVDYAHNPDGLAALGRFVRKLKRPLQRSIGMIGIPGDRRDVDIREMGRLAAGLFDTIVFKEDDERRGRAPGVIAGLLREGALEAGCPPERIHTILPENEAVLFCLQLARPGDLVILGADEYEAVWRQVVEFEGNSPVEDPFRANIRRLKVG